MSALDKFLSKAKAAGKNFMHGAEELGPAGSMKRSAPNVRPIRGKKHFQPSEARRTGGAKDWVEQNPGKSKVAAALGIGIPTGMALDHFNDISSKEDDEDEGLQGLLKRLGIG